MVIFVQFQREIIKVYPFMFFLQFYVYLTSYNSFHVLEFMQKHIILHSGLTYVYILIQWLIMIQISLFLQMCILEKKSHQKYKQFRYNINTGCVATFIVEQHVTYNENGMESKDAKCTYIYIIYIIYSTSHQMMLFQHQGPRCSLKAHQRQINVGPPLIKHSICIIL